MTGSVSGSGGGMVLIMPKKPNQSYESYMYGTTIRRSTKQALPPQCPDGRQADTLSRTGRNLWLRLACIPQPILDSEETIWL